METYLGTVGFGSVNLRQERSLGLRAFGSSSVWAEGLSVLGREL